MPERTFIVLATLFIALGTLTHAEETKKTTEAEYNNQPASNGWPEEMKNIGIRFIRLEHSGKGWDDGMKASGADANLLAELTKRTDFKTAGKGESHDISLIKKYDNDGYPPFLFLTGNDNLGRISSADMKTLRDYCLNHGMLIGDAGSVRFHRSFIHFIRMVFPDKEFVDIANDDPIYQFPNEFPNGPPAFWHHGGNRPLGIKHEGRWVVYYHPGDMNDAWKSEGFSDVSPELKTSAYNLGINLIHYAFKQALSRPEKVPD